MSAQLLVLGTPRSGTTWVFEVLAAAPGVTDVLEPDNEKVSFLGQFFKSHLPRFPTLRPGDEDPNFFSLWQQSWHSPLGSWLATNRVLRTLEGLVFNGEKYVARKERIALEKFVSRETPLSPHADVPLAEPIRRQSNRRRLVKSVHGVFAAEWIAHKTRPDHMVVVQRMPHGILSSMKKLSMGDAFRLGSLAPHLTPDELAHWREASADPAQSLAAAATQMAIMYAWLNQLVKKHSHWIAVTHEHLCENPVDHFRHLFQRLELPWTNKIEEGIRQRDRPGEGFAAVRKASDQIGKWKKSLTSDDIETIDRIFAQRGLEQWTSGATTACATSA